MFKFRGQRKDNGEWVVGWLSDVFYHTAGATADVYVIENKGSSYIVHPHTLSVSFGKLDSQGMEIFASLPIDGVMTKGGDVVEFAFIKYDVEYSDDGGYFCAICCADRHTMTFSEIYSHAFTIIGKQGGEK